MQCALFAGKVTKVLCSVVEEWECVSTSLAAANGLLCVISLYFSLSPLPTTDSEICGPVSLHWHHSP